MKNILITGGSDGLDTIEVAKVVEFLINLPNDVTIPEIGIKNINN